MRGATIRCSVNAYKEFQPAFPNMGEQEAFLVLCLDAKHRVIGDPVLVALGTATTVEVHPRDVFRAAVRRNACAVIVGHNHPSGDCEPSSEDRMLTRRLQEAGDVLGIPVLDHLVATRGRYVSLADRGVIA